MRRTVGVLICSALLIISSGLASAQVQNQGDRPAATHDRKGELGRTDPKPGDAPEASEPKAGTKVLGQPEPRVPGTSK